MKNETFEITGIPGKTYDIRLESIGNGEVAITVAGARSIMGLGEVIELRDFLTRVDRRADMADYRRRTYDAGDGRRVTIPGA